MGQLSAYRFPESSGWEKVWSWTNEEEIPTNYTYYILPANIKDYDFYFITGRNFRSTTHTIYEGSVNLSFVSDKNVSTSTKTANLMSCKIRSDILQGEIILYNFFSYGVNIDSFSVVSFFNINDPSPHISSWMGSLFDDYNYLRFYTQYAGIQPGATIDFYGMNLPK